jgi:hypothetical protein
VKGIEREVNLEASVGESWQGLKFFAALGACMIFCWLFCSDTI